MQISHQINGRLVLGVKILCLLILVNVTHVTCLAADEELQKRFTEFDRDNSGAVSLKEFLTGATDETRTDLRWEFYEHDADANGVLSKEEMENAEPANPSLKLFRGYDVEKDGLLTLKEYSDPAGKKYLEASRQEFLQSDVDGNEKLTYEEFLSTPRPMLKTGIQFYRLDTNQNGLLDLQEYFRVYAKSAQKAARNVFFSYDLNGDLQVSIEEFKLPAKERKPHIKSLFAMRDLNDDGRLSREEYYAPHIGGKWEEAAKAESVRFDADGDKFLSLIEFARTPQPEHARPIVFDILDTDGNAKLSRSEFLNSISPESQSSEKKVFYTRDQDEDDFLSREEFFAPSKNLRAKLKAEFASRDTNDDGRLTRKEYFHKFIGGQWEAAAKKEAVQFDMDEDGYLTIQEFALSPAGSPFPQSVLKALDANNDGALSIREYVHVRPQLQQVQYASEFYRKDEDGNGQLNLEEMQNPSPAAITDMIAELSAKKIHSLHQLWSQIDSDSNGVLDRGEWNSSEVEKHIGDVGTIPFRQWDLDSNGELTKSESKIVIDSSYGVYLLSGKPLRQNIERIVNWAFIKNIDTNHDQKLSQQEYVNVHPASKSQERADQFRQFDQDNNNFLDDVELIDRIVFAINPLHDFCRIDVNLDGELSGTEIVDAAHPWQKKMSQRLVKAFDEDSNGSLNFTEYQQTPYANPVIEWYHGYQDSNGSGRLSWKEFFSNATPEFASIARSVFDGFDLDRDGELSISEFDFSFDLMKLPVDDAFSMLDKNGDGLIEIHEITNLERPDTNDPTAILHWEERTMRSEEVFQEADQNTNGKISPDEFKKNQAALIAVSTGQALPRSPVISNLAAITSETDTESTWNGRFIALITLNVLLMCGFAWLLLK